MATKKSAKAPKQSKKTSEKESKEKGTRKRRGVKIQPTSLGAQELALSKPGLSDLEPELAGLAKAVDKDGGAVLAVYREPLGGKPLLFVSLPIDRVVPTAFQRDVSDAHVLKLTRAMDKTQRFLDPIIAVRTDEHYLTPNGGHRLRAMTELGAKAILALLVPEPEVAYQILALNIEKAHNLRERALEVVRMYRDLCDFSAQKESDFEFEFEEPGLATLGFAYEQRGRFSGGAYNSVLKKVDTWIKETLPKARAERERRAHVLLELDDAVNEAVARLKEQGLTSPYLKAFVVARVNPLRFIKGEPPSFDELLTTMTKRARGMKTEKIAAADLARTGGPPSEE
ncbi:MAG TPA: ParB N-terminal domain-containing protein [Polyangiaceae bacterium]|nr:ParB N-terminal domain-containing protein [Polyangiaceae bacterium]